MTDIPDNLQTVHENRTTVAAATRNWHITLDISITQWTFGFFRSALIPIPHSITKSRIAAAYIMTGPVIPFCAEIVISEIYRSRYPAAPVSTAAELIFPVFEYKIGRAHV